MDQVKMAYELGWDGVAHCPNGLLSTCRVGEDREVGIKEFVRFADGERDTEPVSSRSDGGSVKACVREPRVDSLHTV